MARSSDISNRSQPTGLGKLEDVGAVFAGDETFLRGFSAGVESETLQSRDRNDTGADSPITLIAEMPAWEGSNRGRGLEQDFRFSVGAVFGAFATRAGLNTEDLYEHLADSTQLFPLHQDPQR